MLRLARKELARCSFQRFSATACFHPCSGAPVYLNALTSGDVEGDTIRVLMAVMSCGAARDRRHECSIRLVLPVGLACCRKLPKLASI